MKINVPRTILLAIFALASSQAKAQALLSDSEVQTQILAAINATPLPKQLDQLTTFESMQLFGVRGLQYNYKLGVKKSDLGGESNIKTVTETLRNQSKSTLCTNPVMLWYKSNFIELKYVYHDSTNSKVIDFRLTPNDC